MSKYCIAGIFRGWKLSRIAENRIFAIKTFTNCGKRQSVGVGTSNKIELVRTRWELRSGNHWTRLPCLHGSLGSWCWANTALPASRRQHPWSYAVAFVKNDTPINNGTPVLNENFRCWNFRELPWNHEIHESFHPQKIPAIRYIAWVPHGHFELNCLEVLWGVNWSLFIVQFLRLPPRDSRNWGENLLQSSFM